MHRDAAKRGFHHSSHLGAEAWNPRVTLKDSIGYLMERLIEPFQFAFMREAMLAGGVIGLVCAVLSCYLVLKGWSLMGDAISHAVLPGIVIAYAAGLPLAIGAFVAGLAC